MGQHQQLLLLVLGAIIVGAAILVGAQMFSTSAINANRDAVLQDCLTIAARAQMWYRTPTMLGGGGRDFSDIDLANIRFPEDNENASSFAISVDAANQLTISATGREPQANPGMVTIVIYPDSVSAPNFGGGWQ